MEQHDITSSASAQSATPNSSPDRPKRRQTLVPSPSSQFEPASSDLASSELASSEPTLRFPRPQGNSHLANWISSSDPDIMRLASVATDDTGLSESTYELLSVTDTESQDENYTESMDESVGSLDFHRPDDVHSLAGTEHTQDDEESVMDETELRPDPVTDSAVIVEAVESAQDTAKHEQPDAVDSESDDEAKSRSSLEYTAESLKVPSISVPETSKPGMDLDDCYPSTVEFVFGLFKVMAGSVAGSVAMFLPPLVIGTALIVGFHALYPKAPESSIGRAVTPVATVPDAIQTTAIQVATSTKTTTAVLTTATSPGGVGLVPLDNPTSDDWLFGAKPNVDFSVQSPGEILVTVPPAVKKTWTSKSCLEIAAKRSNDQVDMVSSTVPDGILINFPKKERHGIVTLTVKATCRPKVSKMVKVHFGKGIMEEALEKTKHLVMDFGELVVHAAAEERRLVGTVWSFAEKATKNLGAHAHMLTCKTRHALGAQFTGLETRFSKAQQLLEGATKEMAGAIGTAAESATSNMHKLAEKTTKKMAGVVETGDQLKLGLQTARNSAKLGLLKTQIAAKLWWLKVTSRAEEHGEYQRKARDFLANKLAEAEAKYVSAKPVSAASRSWGSMLKRRRCKATAGHGRRGVQ
jgi:hypothetical protein